MTEYSDLPPISQAAKDALINAIFQSRDIKYVDLLRIWPVETEKCHCGNPPHDFKQAPG